eukprot:GFUD01084361.1.p1 GENE.GFUD01084361.1~~GFUD01084361.1.p1  ORF type:complete len:440 (-),score=114.09 GFUD01084361.1:267-1586(-)
MAASGAEDIDWQLIKTLVFGDGVKEAVFERWLQPFLFSTKEPTALLQSAGGPCAVLAPIQAFILKRCLQSKIPNLSTLTPESVSPLLQGAMCDILSQCREEETSPMVLARVSRDVADILQDNQEKEESSSKRMKHSSHALVDVDTFHTCLSVESFGSVKNLSNYLEDNFSEIFGTKYDILSFLYSVVLTKGPNSIISERQDMEESLIDPVHGHGSQSLINLLLTGSATQNVFDGIRDLCGLQLNGISSQSSVGFLSYLECLRYLEVGKFLKNPVWPVWLLGSETHLTVLFSRDMELVGPPSQRDIAKEKFTCIDKEGSGFIAVDKLKNLMLDLDLFAEDPYVDIMKTKLDPDSLGIVLLPQFLEEFFPEESRVPDSFTIHHYNGLSKPDSTQVTYIKGDAVMLEGMVGMAENNAILQTLQTKWRNIAVDWQGGGKPSIN